MATKTKQRLYVAYGSNLNLRQMQLRCPEARVVGTSVIPDYRLMFKGSRTGAYLTIEPEAGHSVPVGIWAVSPDDEQALDRYEGCPKFYYKTELTLPVKNIRTGGVRRRRAFVYIMHEKQLFGVPTDSYLRTCMEGYQSFGFDPALLTEAYEFSR